MEDLTAVFIDKRRPGFSVHYWKWPLFGELVNGHYYGSHQSRDRFVHHLAII